MRNHQKVAGTSFAIIPNLPTGDGKKCRAVMSLTYPFIIYRLYMYNPNDKGEGRRIVEIERGAVPEAVAHPSGLRLYAAPMGTAFGMTDREFWHFFEHHPDHVAADASAALLWFAENGLSSTEAYNLAKTYRVRDERELRDSIAFWLGKYGLPLA